MKKITAVLFALLFYLLAFPAEALHAARAGLLLWYHSVLPVLFPFMLISGILMHFDLPGLLLPYIARPFHFLFRVSPYGAFAVLSGFLCGFPMGAKVTSDLLAQKKITREEAFHLYGFVNNLSPSFILSFIAADQMQQPSWGILFLLNILGSAVLYGCISSRRLQHGSGHLSAEKHARAAAHSFPRNEVHVPDLQTTFSLIDDCIYNSIENTVRLGAYIVMFSILGSAAAHFIPAGHPLTLFLLSSIEVSNGVHLLASSGLPLFARFLLINILGAFGGFSALAQTASIAAMNRELFLHYTKSRVKITLLCALLSSASVLFVRFFLL